jgi:hypothetical protein
MTTSRSLLRFTNAFVLPPSLLRFKNPALKLSNIRALSSTSRSMAQEYKLKGLSSLDLKPGEKIEVEVEGVEEGKVLLCNVGGKITALGSKCTHYGAPLVKGVLTGDGRITCPWHGGMSTTSDLCGLDGIADVLQLVSMLPTETSKMPLLSIPSLRSPSPKKTDLSTLLASKEALKAVVGSLISRLRVVSADRRRLLLLVEVAVHWERLRL